MARVTAKFVLNNREMEQWSRVFITEQVTDLSDKLLRAAQDEAPVRTGRLRQSLKTEPVVMTGPNKGEGGISAQTPYAGFVRSGTRPHVIRPRNAQALRFEVRGRIIFAKSVNHPGTKPNFFLERALDRVARDVR